MRFSKKLRVIQFFTLILFLSFGSCTEELVSDSNQDILTSEELIVLKDQIQNSIPFITFMESNHVFFKQLKNKEINLFAINDFISNINIVQSCDQLESYNSDLYGYSKYVAAYCAKLNFSSDIVIAYPLLLRLSEKEIRFVFRNDNPLKINTRALDCFDQFQADWAQYEADMLEDRESFETPVENYDDCCKDESGTNGCP